MSAAKTTLADQFKGEYLFVIVGAADCNACLASARLFEGPDVQGLFASGKCAQADLVKGSLDVWGNALGGTAVRHSYNLSDSAYDPAKLAAAFGVDPAYVQPLGLLLKKDAAGAVTKVNDTGRNALTPNFIEALTKACGT